MKCPKTEASRRAVPLPTIALEALEQQQSSRESALVFPAERGGYIDRHNFRLREWKPAQLMAGIEPLRRMNSAPAGVHGWTTVDAAWTPPTEAAVRGDTEDSG